MTLDRVILHDFLTYDFLDYIFERRPLIFQGLNLTDYRQKTNGTGKSGKQTAIEFCMSASNSRGVPDSELVQFGKDQARVQLFSSCDFRQQNIHIDWTIKVKGSNKVIIKTKAYDEEWLEDEPDGSNPQKASFSNVNDGKKFIKEWFLIEKEDLFNYYIINKARFKSFFQSSNTEKVALINRFSDASLIKNVEVLEKDKLQEEADQLQEEFTLMAGAIAQLEKQILKETSRDLAAETEDAKEAISDDIADANESISTAEGTKIVLKEDIAELDEEDIELLKGIKETETNKGVLEKDLEAANKSMDEVKSSVKMAQTKVDDYISTDWDSKRETFEDDIKVRETLKDAPNAII